jgi:hypothetical protein
LETKGAAPGCRGQIDWVVLNWRTASEGGPYKGKKKDAGKIRSVAHLYGGTRST